MARLSYTFFLLFAFSGIATSLAMYIDGARSVKISIMSITQAEFNAGLNTSCSNIHTAETNSAVLQDIASLESITNSIETEFQRVGLQLEALTESGGQQLASDWNNILQQFEGFLDNSVNTANSIESNLQEFITEIIPELIEIANSGDDSEAFSVLGSFGQTVQTFPSQAQLIVDNFQSLQESLIVLALTAQINGLGNSTSIGSTLPVLVGQLNATVNIWEAVLVDSQETGQVIANLISLPTDVGDLVFWENVEQVTCFFQVMIPVLKNYTSATQDF